jgi:transcriptional regulator with GAF, ATPase, and Fis domain/tetratricopeptide (TPR) repeat protein
MGIKRTTGERHFLKIPSKDGALDQDRRISILLKSFACQQELKSSRVLRASGRHAENGTLIIEYPYLDQTRWHALTPPLFWDRFPAILIQSALIVDYLHLFGLVHGDLKFENYQVNLAGTEPGLILSDLDFLTQSHSDPHSRIFGTPEHIAPEIMENEIILPQSDNFSFGVSLRKYLETDVVPSRRGEEVPDFPIEKLAELAAGLTKPEPSQRPRGLLEALLQYEIIDASQFRSALRDLLAMQLTTRFRTDRTGLSKGEISFQGFLTERNRLFGICDELVADLAQAFKSQRLSVLNLFLSLIREAEINKYGDYWQLDVSDDLLERTFVALEKLPVHGTEILWNAPIKDRADFESYIAKAMEFKKSGFFTKALLLLKHLNRNLNILPEEAAEAIGKNLFRELGSLASGLGRTSEAIEHYERVLASSNLSTPDDLSLLIELNYQYMLTGRYDKSEALLERCLVAAKTSNDKKAELSALRNKAWIMYAHGRLEEAETVLVKLLHRAEESNEKVEVGKINVILGIINQSRGEFNAAEENFLKALEIFREEKRISDAILPLTYLSVICFDTGEYSKAIRFGKTAVKYCQQPSDQFRLPAIYATIVTSLGRLADYQKAEYWLQKYINSHPVRYDRPFFLDFYILAGNLRNWQGDYRSAKDLYLKALELFPAREKNRHRGQLLQSLGLLAAYRGSPFECSQYLEQSRKEAEGSNDRAALVEITLVHHLNALYNENGKVNKEYLDILTELLARNCFYYAAICLFHILLDGPTEVKKEALAAAGALLRQIRTSTNPLFQTVSMLIAVEEQGQSTEHDILPYWKATYRTLGSGGCKYWALFVCGKIAEYYLHESKTKLARKFLNQTQRMAESIGNITLTERISRQINAITDERQSQSKIIESVYGVSEVLKNIDNYEVALQKLVQYAVDETGAERGVLLLGTEQSSELQVKAFVNCDDESLKDIIDFSRTIPKTVAEDLKPVIIDNALEDNRTKKYKSIIAHNILSVICVPVPIKDRSMGVFYLDHHTIPALFEREDVTFIYSMANFMSVLLSTIQNFRVLDYSRRQLTEDLFRSGAKQPLITESETMKALLSRLPEIARSNASVLIFGENGTGKEILCQMIHDLSGRAKATMVKLNCAAIAPNLIESELFGVANNVATGVAKREGKFSAADGSTLFLDEIGDMPLEIQSKVLRVLEYQQFEKVGSNRTTTVDIRFIYATNKNLREMVVQGRFREDLYYRINKITIDIPPLRERCDDIPRLLDYFSHFFAPDVSRRPVFSAEAINALMAYQWPGNVRELRNMIEKYCILNPGQRIDLAELPIEIGGCLSGNSRNDETSRAIEKARIRELLNKNKWNMSKVARILKMPLSTLIRKIRKYGIRRDL